MHESVDMEDLERLIAVQRTKNNCLDDILARLVWLREKGLLSMSPKYLSFCASRELAKRLVTAGNTSYLQAFLNFQFVTDNIIIRKVEKRGLWKVLQQLQEWGYSIPAWSVPNIVKNLGKAEQLKLSDMEAMLAGLGPELVLTSDVANAVVQSGDVALVSWMLERGFQLDEGAFEAAADCGKLEMLEWLEERSCPRPVGYNAYLAAATRGDLQTLRYVHKIGCGNPAERPGADLQRRILSGTGASDVLDDRATLPLRLKCS
ncbi:hypothetical protein Vafri_5025 [Volvox africanus]|uniref:Uncharacterized protein n=1 Tax=Volvox africanus TaxID=51714 RepID=A0A8J4AVF4_9CHLO|nr:hypothetical protein Vafri_5025 [Volvox africanus]